MCTYCSKQPVWSTSQEFSDLAFLPLPLIDATGERYQKFDKLYGSEPKDTDRPSLKPSLNGEKKK